MCYGNTPKWIWKILLLRPTIGDFHSWLFWTPWGSVPFHTATVVGFGPDFLLKFILRHCGALWASGHCINIFVLQHNCFHYFNGSLITQIRKRLPLKVTSKVTSNLANLLLRSNVRARRPLALLRGLKKLNFTWLCKIQALIRANRVGKDLKIIKRTWSSTRDLRVLLFFIFDNCIVISYLYKNSRRWVITFWSCSMPMSLRISIMTRASFGKAFTSVGNWSVSRSKYFLNWSRFFPLGLKVLPPNLFKWHFP